MSSSKRTLSMSKKGKIRKNSSSPYKGVSIAKSTNGKIRWRATLTANKTLYQLGYFNTQEDAAKAYDLKVLELFGSNAYTNFPCNGDLDREFEASL